MVQVEPPRKRPKHTHESNSTSSNRLFVPFRALGLVTNHVPFVLQTRSYKGSADGPQTYILSCLGKSWALWEGGRITLLFVGPQLEDHISSLALDGDDVWTASGPHLIKCFRGKEVSRLSNPLSTPLVFITIFATQLLALTEDGRNLLIWNKTSGEFEGIIKFNGGFTATLILHPATYINKILVASAEGTMQLWNIQTRTCLHTFSASNLVTNPSSNHISITALCQSPAIDVVGIGFTSGEISVYDIRTDERLMRMFMEGGSIRALGFRTDGQPIMASASSAGHLAIWDLDSGGRLLHMVRGAHDGSICALEWIPGQPVLATSGEDNSIKQWLFDSPTATPRLLKYRAGHHAPPHLIRFYGDDGKQLITASRDRSLRCTSVVRDSRSFELSQGSLARKAANMSISVASLKFPHITSMSFSTTRAKDWDNVLTGHAEDTFARSWSMQNKKVGKHTFGFAEDIKGKGKERLALGSCKAVCVTACGNFGIAGSSTGQIHMWNLQSGIKRKSFVLGVAPPEVTNRTVRMTKKKGEGRCISGIASDSLNRVVVVSTLDGTMNFFDFYTSKLEHSVVLPSSVVAIHLQRDSGLIAVICDDLVVRVLDLETRRIVRELGGFKGRLLDLAFSPDSRWLVTSSMDSIIRTFDLPTGHLIDAFRTPTVATSVAFSPTNDFLATSHVDSVGVFLWANRAQYSDTFFQSISDAEITLAAMPSMQGADEEDVLDALSELNVSEKHKDVFSTPPQLEGDLITLTLLPRARWQTLLHLEVIAQRNKPKEPPKPPEKAPFFLPTLPGVEQRFISEDKEKKDDEPKKTRRLDKIAAETESVFLEKLLTESANGDYETLFVHAKALSPAALELEVQSLVTLEHMASFINALTQRLRSRKDFEAVQTLQTLFLRTHADEIIENEELHDSIRMLKEVHEKESRRILELLASSLGTLGFVRQTMS
ncbi:Utp21 specific WD40 associated putative domain-containing protein [Flagelloscypha sp. PMI_526]|nr:Utp21 specific WD40 associated putative domain-containing protein [Flagelloscypha sp. PMI_526]